MSCYQSGFAYDDRQAHAKPGLTCHARAIQGALNQAIASYDFLAGEDRYKRSLADSIHQQIWAAAGPFWSPSLLAGAAGDRIRMAIAGRTAACRPSASGA
jgi:CelD/BcsL family acetyltransferase involved in cellulose biosynthesis